MISVDAKQFSKALALCDQAMRRRNMIPALSSVRIQANGSLNLMASDLDTQINIAMPYDGDAGLEFCLSEPWRLRAALKHGAAVTIADGKEGGLARVLELKSGQFTAKLRAPIHFDDHVKEEVIDTAIFSAVLGVDALGQIKRVIPAISQEETRYYLNGVNMRRIGDWLFRFAATDGHRLMVADVPLPDFTGELPDNCIIPRRLLDAMVRMFGKDGGTVQYGCGRASNDRPVTTADDVRGVRLEIAGPVGEADLRLIGKLIDGRYPDYNRVIPASFEHMFEVDRCEIIAAIGRLMPLGEGRVRAVRLSAEDAVFAIELDSPDMGQARVEIPMRGGTLPVKIGFNGQYLLDCLNALKGEVARFSLGGVSLSSNCHDPVRIDDPADTAFFSILMPMRV